MQEQVRNRDWVKNAAIIFLVVLLVLTFFSNTIMNRSLPEVATQEVESGSIVARVRGTGTVQANSNTQVKMDRTRVIRSVLVKVGQKVEAGDVLFTLGEGASEEIDAAEETLMNLQASYNRTAATIPSYSYGAEQNRIAHLEEAYREAQIAEDAALKAAQQAATNADKIAIAEKELEQAIADRDTEKAAYDKELQAANNSSDIQAKEDQQKAIIEEVVSKNALEGDLVQGSYEDRDKLTTQISRIELIIAEEKTAAEKAAADAAAAAAAEAAAAEAAAEAAANAAAQAEAEASAAAEKAAADAAAAEKAQKEKELADAQKAAADALKEAAEAQKAAAEAQKAAAEKAAAEAAAAAVAVAETPMEQLEQANNGLNLGSADSNNGSEITEGAVIEEENIENSDNLTEQPLSFKWTNKLNSALLLSVQPSRWDIYGNSSIELNNIIPKSPRTGDYPYSQYNEWKAHPAEWKQYLEDKLLEYDNLQREIYNLLDYLAPSREAYDAAVAAVEKWQTALSVLYASGDTPQSEAYKNAKQERIYAEESYLSAKQALRDKMSAEETAMAGYNADLANLWRQIERARKKLEDLQGGEEATVTAKVAGTIQTLDASPGDTKKKDDVIATIEAPDMGYTLSFSVTNDQASRLRVGDTGTVSNFYWGSEITATLNSIKIDQKNPQTNKILTFDLSGNVTSGTELTLSVGQKSANYDVIIPSSSVRTDANGTYVLKLESKNSPLGNRYLARRVPVEVLAVDDTNSAVSADLGYGDYVITSSSSPLKNGQLVRLATSG